MIFKSAVVGLLWVAIAVVLTATVMVAIFFAIVLLTPAPKDGTAIGWDPISLTKPGLVWIIPIAAFWAGFVWQFRRLRQ